MLDVEVSPITSQQQYMDDHYSPAHELHAITALDWLEWQMHVHENNYYYSVLHTLNTVVYRCYKKAATTCSMHKRLWMHRMGWQ